MKFEKTVTIENGEEIILVQPEGMPVIFFDNNKTSSTIFVRAGDNIVFAFHKCIDTEIMIWQRKKDEKYYLHARFRLSACEKNEISWNFSNTTVSMHATTGGIGIGLTTLGKNKRWGSLF